VASEGAGGGVGGRRAAVVASACRGASSEKGTRRRWCAVGGRWRRWWCRRASALVRAVGVGAGGGGASGGGARGVGAGGVTSLPPELALETAAPSSSSSGSGWRRQGAVRRLYTPGPLVPVGNVILD
jgi:hypothetical protein